jgi:membrane associated rhomboid family serine protease
MTTLTQDIKAKFSRLNILEIIVIINCVIFLLGRLISFLGFGQFDESLSWLEFSPDLSKSLYQPWTLLSYAFVHYGFYHLLFNMLLLYFLGGTFSNLFDKHLTLRVFILGILSGALAFVVVYYVNPNQFINRSTSLVGASAGVGALFIFLCAYMRHMEVNFFTFRIKLSYLGLAMVLLDVFKIIPSLIVAQVPANFGGLMAHFGGYIIGYLYAVRLQKGTDIGRFLDPVFSLFNKSVVLKTAHKQTHKRYAGMMKNEFDNYTHQKQIDLILDKISKSGYESLTADEKEFLFRAGKK